jgi:ABC-type Zn uptake system ZnuABC Zn-binding protein ZnuA
VSGSGAHRHWKAYPAPTVAASRRVSRLGLALLAPVLAATPAAAAAEAPIRVVVTIEPLRQLVVALGGDRVTAVALVPPGASPHVFEPRPGDLARAANAQLLMRMGGGLDDWAARLFDAVNSGARQLVLLGSGRRDPHVWLDPIRVRDGLAPAIAAALAAVDPTSANDYARHLADFEERLTALDGEIRGILAGHGRHYVAFHAAWRYFARRYGLEEVAVVEEAGGEEPTPGELAQLVRAARRIGVPAILVEPQLDPRIARILAAEFGGTLVEVDPLGDPGDPERGSYIPLMRWNAREFARGLGGGSE